MNVTITKPSKREISYPILLRNTAYPDVIVLAVTEAEGESRFAGVVLQGREKSGLDTGKYYPNLGHYAFTIADDVEVAFRN